MSEHLLKVSPWHKRHSLFNPNTLKVHIRMYYRTLQLAMSLSISSVHLPQYSYHVGCSRRMHICIEHSLHPFIERIIDSKRQWLETSFNKLREAPDNVHWVWCKGCYMCSGQQDNQLFDGFSAQFIYDQHVYLP